MKILGKTLEILKRTWNGAVTNESTLNFNLDMFAYSSRDPKQDYEKSKNRFKNALIENDKIALANLLYTLDIRNGKGERALFKSYFSALIEMNKDYAIQILPYISELGRWDYVFEGIGTEIEEAVYDFVKAYLMMDIKNYNDNKPVSLLAKWLPSIKTHNKKNHFAIKLAKKLNLTEKEYRKILSKLRDRLNIVEKHITNKEYEKIDYISVPSKAMIKYKSLFFSKDEIRFKEFIEELKNSKKTKYDNLFMNDFVKMYLDNLRKIGVNYFYGRTIKEAYKNSISDLIKSSSLKELEDRQILLQKFKDEKNLINTMWKKQSKIKFDKNTIDHLGIKLYSKFPPVIAELISNSYDADAENVVIEIDYNNKIVTVTDDGIGMNHEELNENFLKIGRNRRKAEGTGLSKIKGRKVTGKKGLGKLAVFGIANTIEVHSIKEGIKNAFSMNYDELKAEIKDEYKPKALYENEKTDELHQTQVIIKEITQKNIMDIDTLAYNLSKRFSFYDSDFKVELVDLTSDRRIEITKSIYFEKLDKEFDWNFPDDFESELSQTEWFEWLKSHNVSGKIFTKKTPLNKSEAGFYIYVRNKLAAENDFFDDRANDTFNGYVTGYFNIDFIDDSNEADFISTDRKNILWEADEDTAKLKQYLNKLVSKVSNSWRKKRKDKKEEQLQLPEDFFEGMSKLEISSINKVKDTLIANSIETDNIDSLKRILDSMKTLYKFESFQNYIAELDDEDLTVDKVEKITTDWEYIESKELAKISIGRIKAIEQFEKYVRNDASETKVIQPFLEKFPWILDPRITTFEREVTFKKILKENFPDTELEEKNRRLDFLCNLVNGELIIIELKRPRIKISLKEIRQAREYERFLLKNHKESIANGVKTFLISDSFVMDDETTDFYSSLEDTGKLYIKSYSDLLQQAKQYNKDYITRYKEIESIYKPDKEV